METPQEPTSRSCSPRRRRRKRRRSCQHAHWLSEEEIPYYDDGSGSKPISGEPTTAEEEDEEEEEEEDEEEELAPESSMEKEKDDFALYQQSWESSFKHRALSFNRITSLSPMVFTHYTPRSIPREAELAPSLQVCSIKVAKIMHLEWPLHVYGTVAARDSVDHKRNILFFRPRSRSQTLTKNDPFLHLTGPRRAILSEQETHIEFQLMVKQGQSCRPLVTQAFRYYNGSNCDWFYSCLSNYLCKIELCFEQLTRSRQATVLAIRVTRGSPFRYGGQVVCCASPYMDNDPNKEIVLFDSKYGPMDSDGTMSMDPDGNLELSRRVVSVQGRLKIFVNSYSRSGAVRASGRVSFRAKDCQTSQARCVLHSHRKASGKGEASSEGKDEVKIHVAWSRFARKISDIEIDCFTNL